MDCEIVSGTKALQYKPGITQWQDIFRSLNGGKCSYTAPEVDGSSGIVHTDPEDILLHVCLFAFNPLHYPATRNCQVKAHQLVQNTIIGYAGDGHCACRGVNLILCCWNTAQVHVSHQHRVHVLCAVSGTWRLTCMQKSNKYD